MNRNKLKLFILAISAAILLTFTAGCATYSNAVSPSDQSSDDPLTSTTFPAPMMINSATDALNSGTNAGTNSEGGSISSAFVPDDIVEKDADNDSDLFFTILFNDLAVTSPLIDTPDINDYISANRDIVDVLLSYSDETLYQSFYYLLSIFPELPDDPENVSTVSKADLVFYIIKSLLKDDPYGGIIGESEMLSKDAIRRIAMVAQSYWLNYGIKWLAENASGLAQIHRAMKNTPVFRIIISEVDGTINNSLAAGSASNLFSAIFNHQDDILIHSEMTNLPQPPESVVNEHTVWTMSEGADGTIILAFSDESSGSNMGRMIYYPTADELAGHEGSGYGYVEIIEN